MHSMPAEECITSFCNLGSFAVRWSPFSFHSINLRLTPLPCHKTGDQSSGEFAPLSLRTRPLLSQAYCNDRLKGASFALAIQGNKAA